MMPTRDEKATCIECGEAVAWWYHHEAFQWTTDRRYAAMTSFCYPFEDFEKKHSVLDPTPWLLISDQVRGEFRSDVDKGYHDVSGTWWALSPRPGYEQNKEKYA